MMTDTQIENLQKAIDALQGVQDKDSLPFGAGGFSSKSRSFKSFKTIVWLSLGLEICWFFLQLTTATKGAKDAEEAICDGLSSKSYVEWPTWVIMVIGALGDLYTNVWAVSPKYDTNRLLYGDSSIHHDEAVVAITFVKYAFFISAAPSYAVGAAANWLGAQPLISSENDTDKDYFLKNSFVLVSCLVAGMVYYFANARFGFARTVNAIQEYFYQSYPSASHWQFWLGGYLRGLFASFESLRTILVRSVSFVALFDLLYSALRVDLSSDWKVSLRVLVFLTTAITVMLSRLTPVVKQWVNPAYAKLSDLQKSAVLEDVTIRNVLFNKLFLTESITAVGVYFFSSFFLGDVKAIPVAFAYFLLSYAAVRDQRICKVASELPSDATHLRGSEVSSDGLSLQGDNNDARLSSVERNSIQEVTDPKEAMNLRNSALEAFASTFTNDVLTRCNIACSLRVFARSFQLISFVRDTSEKADIDLPLYGSLLMIATAVMRNEFFFFRANMVEYQTLSALSAYLIYSKLTDEERSFEAFYTLSNWRLQYQLLSVGVDDFGIQDIIDAANKRIQEPAQTNESASVLSWSNVFACCSKQENDSALDQPLLT